MSQLFMGSDVPGTMTCSPWLLAGLTGWDTDWGLLFPPAKEFPDGDSDDEEEDAGPSRMPPPTLLPWRMLSAARSNAFRSMSTRAIVSALLLLGTQKGIIRTMANNIYNDQS